MLRTVVILVETIIFLSLKEQEQFIKIQIVNFPKLINMLIDPCWIKVLISLEAKIKAKKQQQWKKQTNKKSFWQVV